MKVTGLETTDLQKARTKLLSGDVVGMPTETVYGLAASIESEAALKKVFAVKKRPFFDPLIVHVASFAQAKSLVTEWSPLTDFLARSFWPGPLTIVLPKADHVNSLITSGLDTVAIRFPKHAVAEELIELVGTPLAAPSANQFGKTSPSTAAHVRSEFPDLFVLDGGECEVGLESTVVQIDDTQEPAEVRILRPGGITKEMIESKLERWSKPAKVFRTESPVAPGHLKHHYMPAIPLVIVSSDEPKALKSETLTRVKSDLVLSDIKNPKELVLSDDPVLAARELYSEMRKVAESGADLLFVRARKDESGLWSAIWDRLGRAATLDLR